VKDHSNGDLPPFPSSPEGVARMEHMPTIEACIRYWEAIRSHAIQTRDPALEFIAIGLRAAYEEARHELTKAKPVNKTNAAPHARRGRLPSEPSHSS
jgi:hypothetical protein